VIADATGYYLAQNTTDAGIVSDANDHCVTVNGVTTTHSDGKPKFGKIEWGVAHVKLIRRYYECLKTGEPFEIGFEEGRRVIDLILAMYRSEGKEIPTL